MNRRTSLGCGGLMVHNAYLYRSAVQPINRQQHADAALVVGDNVEASITARRSGSKSVTSCFTDFQHPANLRQNLRHRIANPSIFPTIRAVFRIPPHPPEYFCIIEIFARCSVFLGVFAIPFAPRSAVATKIAPDRSAPGISFRHWGIGILWGGIGRLLGVLLRRLFPIRVPHLQVGARSTATSLVD